MCHRGNLPRSPPIEICEGWENQLKKLAGQRYSCETDRSQWKIDSDRQRELEAMTQMYMGKSLAIEIYCQDNANLCIEHILVALRGKRFDLVLQFYARCPILTPELSVEITDAVIATGEFDLLKTFVGKGCAVFGESSVYTALATKNVDMVRMVLAHNPKITAENLLCFNAAYGLEANLLLELSQRALEQVK